VLRFSGQDWSTALSGSYAAVLSQCVDLASSALSVPASSIVQGSLSVGSLIFQFQVLGAIQSDSAVALLQRANTSALALLYHNVTSSLDAVTVQSVSVFSQSASPTNWTHCTFSACTILVYVAIALGALILLLGTALLCRNVRRSNRRPPAAATSSAPALELHPVNFRQAQVPDSFAVHDDDFDFFL
jgi:hypothetical protein